MKKKEYHGVVVPMVTPVTEEGRLDVAAVERIIRFFAQAGVSPLLMGTTGEGNSVSQNDGLLLVQTAVKAREQCSMTIYAGLTGNCFAEQKAQAEAYIKAGADVIVATLPTYYALTPEQMENYYLALADVVGEASKLCNQEQRIVGEASKLCHQKQRIVGEVSKLCNQMQQQSLEASPTTVPLMLYNILATTHMSIPVDVIKRLADHPNIVGLKDSERDLERMAQCIEITKTHPDFAYFCGWAAQSAHSLELGGNGIVPSTGNFVPEMFQQLFDAAVAGDMETANRLQEETNEIAKIYQKDRTLGQSLTALKVMMQTKGLCEPWMLMPLTRLSVFEERAITLKAQAV